jgi:hypothetical protein
MNRIARIAVSCAALVTLLLAASVAPAAGPNTVGGQLTLHPPEGANDLHMDFWFNDTTLLGAQIGSNQGGVTPGDIHGSGDLNPPNPRAQSWTGATVDNGGVPFTDPVVLAVDLTITKKNRCRWKGTWTKDGNEMNGPGAGIASTGFDVGGPTPTPGGGGGFNHPLTIYNDDLKDLIIRDLAITDSMDYVASGDLHLIDFGVPIVAEAVLPPESSLTIDYFTDTSMRGGFIYFSFLAIDEESGALGRHPVDIPEPSTCLLVVLAGIGLLISARN